MKEEENFSVDMVVTDSVIFIKVCNVFIFSLCIVSYFLVILFSSFFSCVYSFY